MNCTLLENGLDYILNSCKKLNFIENGDNTTPENILAYKYIVRDLISGVEIIFKYRLELENWTYIVDKLNNVTINDYKSGNFNSINLEEAMVRLKNLCNVEIFENERISFKELKRIRNKIEHFRLAIDTDEEKIKFAVLINKCLSAIINFIDEDNDNFKNKFTAEEESLFEEIKETILTLGEFLTDRYNEIVTRYPNNDFVRCPNCDHYCLDIRKEEDTNKCLLCLYEKDKEATADDYIETAVSYRDIAKGAEALQLYDCTECGAYNMMTVDYIEDQTICFECGNIGNINDFTYCESCGKPMDKDNEIDICDSCFDEKVRNSD